MKKKRIHHPYDPWSNPDLAPPRAPIGRAWRSGRRKLVAFLVIVAGSYAVYSLIGGEHGFLRLRSLRAEEARLQAEIQASSDRTRSLERDLQDIERTIEERARTTFEMAAPREMIYHVVDEPAPPEGEEGVDGGEGSATGTVADSVAAAEVENEDWQGLPE